MKYIGVFLFICLSANAQIKIECDSLIVNKSDKMTGESFYTSTEVLIVTGEIPNEGFGISFMQSKKIFAINFKVVGASNCIDADNYMNILFRDGTKLLLSNDTKYNCDGKFTLYFGGSYGKKNQLEEFKTKDIEAIRITTTKGFVQKDFTNEQSEIFKKTLICLSN